MSSEARGESLTNDERARLWFLEGAHRLRLATRSHQDFEEMFRTFLDAMLAVFGCDRAGLVYPCSPCTAGADSWGFTTVRTREGVENASPRGGIPARSTLFGKACSTSGPVRFTAEDGDLEAPIAFFGSRAVLATCLKPKGAPGAFLLAIGDDAPREPHPLERELFAEAARELAHTHAVLRVARSVRESETRFAEAGRLAQLGYWELDLLTDRVFWSDEIFRLLGHEPGSCEAIASTFRAQIHPDDRERHLRVIDEAHRAQTRYEHEYRIVRPDGEVRTVHSVGAVVRNESGKPYRMFGVIRDITDAKRAAEEIALVRQLLDHTNDAIEVIDPMTRRFLDVNERACIAHGYTREEYLKLRIEDVDPTAVTDPWPRRVELLRRQGSRIVEGVHRRKDGTTFPVEVNVTLIQRDREYALAIVRDITERKRLEQELRSAQKMEAVGRLAGGVAHDFNNLLTVVNNGAEMVLDSLPADHPDRDVLEDMLDAGLRGANLTRQLLAFSRTQQLEVEVVDLATTLRSLTHLLRRVLGEDIEMTIVSEPGLGRVKVDASQLEQVILNLAVNARDAMPRGGTLTVDARNVDVADGPVPRGRWVRIRVTDSGHGIPEDDRSRVFDPFFTTKEPGRGTGLGLAMVYGFVKQSGGHILLDSSVGRGTTFTIYLPRTDELLATSLRRETKSVAPRGSETVLLVEDEDRVRRLAKRALLHHGYDVLEAADGPMALSLFRDRRGAIDILVTDVVMPRMSGTELADVLTRERPELPVLLMSGYSDVTSHSRGRDLAAILPKPFRSKDLARSVRSVLDGTPARTL